MRVLLGLGHLEVKTYRAYFFARIELTLPIGSGLDRVNFAQVGGAIQSKEHSELRE